MPTARRSDDLLGMMIKNMGPVSKGHRRVLMMNVDAATVSQCLTGRSRHSMHVCAHGFAYFSLFCSDDMQVLFDKMRRTG